MTRLLYTTEEWVPGDLEKVIGAMQEIYDKEIGIPYYPFQVHIINSEQMIDNYVSYGVPFYYPHWSFGKQFAQFQRAYKAGNMGLALEMVINSKPCIVYCMEENSMTANTLVLAHAGYGHNAVFANNYLFKQWTNAEGIVDYAAYAERYIVRCEQQYGYAAVEEVLDAAHALAPHGVHHYSHPKRFSLDEEQKRLRERLEYQEKQYNILMPKPVPSKEDAEAPKGTLEEPVENILYFIEKHAPMLPEWKREIIRIVYVLAQYLYPQRLTKVLNEGFATFTHYYIMHRMHEEGLISDAALERFIRLHTSVINQPEFDSGHFRQINPYALGFAIFMDIKRVCENPTDEDKQWFPHVAGKDWRKVMKDVVEMCRDDSFILHHLSPKIIRDFHLFSLIGASGHDHVLITAIHRDDGYKTIRDKLSQQYDPSVLLPLIEVVRVDILGDRTLELRHRELYGRELHMEDTVRTMVLAEKLWGFPVELTSIKENGDTALRMRVMQGSPSYYVRYQQ